MSTVVFDIDGTIADLTHRLPHIQKEVPDWQSFHDAMPEDKPIEKVIEVLRNLRYARVNIALFTGRPESHRLETALWLRKHGVPFDSMWMRKTGDHRPDVQVKPELMERLLLATGVRRSEVLGIFEDRPSMCKEWRRLGFKVFQLGDKEF